jgi:hypothetical protein
MADGQRAAGPDLAWLCQDALQALVQVERDKSEILRLLFLVPITDDMAMPLPTKHVLKQIKSALEQ